MPSIHSFIVAARLPNAAGQPATSPGRDGAPENKGQQVGIVRTAGGSSVEASPQEFPAGPAPPAGSGRETGEMRKETGASCRSPNFPDWAQRSRRAPTPPNPPTGRGSSRAGDHLGPRIINDRRERLGRDRGSLSSRRQGKATERPFQRQTRNPCACACTGPSSLLQKAAVLEKEAAVFAPPLVQTPARLTGRTRSLPSPSRRDQHPRSAGGTILHGCADPDAPALNQAPAPSAPSRGRPLPPISVTIDRCYRCSELPATRVIGAPIRCAC